mmetsp:Transcript_4673/g.5208  ORF Transcript_4673/g.5208 Transcript_4673/m.5208 type:complete len:311 (-) Transcript_4673:509-1441(-)
MSVKHGKEVADKLLNNKFNLLPLNKNSLAPLALHQAPPPLQNQPLQPIKFQQDSSQLTSNHINHPLEPNNKRIKVSPASTTENIDKKLGKYILNDLNLLHELGWKGLVQRRRQDNDWANVKNIPHPASRLLHQYKTRGVPVKFKTKAWTKQQIELALKRGPHKSCQEHLPFLQEEFIDMHNKGQWMILPYNAVKDLPGLRLSPPGVIPQRDRRPRWIVDYSWWDVNEETLPLAPKDAMQFGHALDRLLREILLANPDLGPIYLMKVDIADGFYRIHLNIDDIPKLGVIFPVKQGHRQSTPGRFFSIPHLY